LLAVGSVRYLSFIADHCVGFPRLFDCNSLCYCMNKRSDLPFSAWHVKSQSNQHVAAFDVILFTVTANRHKLSLFETCVRTTTNMLTEWELNAATNRCAKQHPPLLFSYAPTKTSHLYYGLNPQHKTAPLVLCASTTTRHHWHHSHRTAGRKLQYSTIHLLRMPRCTKCQQKWRAEHLLR
jgi:hypothetical protein